jgi:hypothetical protein
MVLAFKSGFSILISSFSFISLKSLSVLMHWYIGIILKVPLLHIFKCSLIYIYERQLVERRSSNSKVAGSRPCRGRQHLSACAGYGNYIIHTLEHYHLNKYIYIYIYEDILWRYFADMLKDNQHICKMSAIFCRYFDRQLTYLQISATFMQIFSRYVGR